MFGGDVVVKNIKGGGKRGNISDNISQTTSTRSLEAMCRNCITNLLDGIIRELELIAICVEQLPIGSLQVKVVGRFE